MKRRVYLEMKSLEEARRVFFARLEVPKPRPHERIRVIDSLGRVTASPVRAVFSCPNFDASAMDGVAVVADSTNGASPTTPVELRLGDEAVMVDTGDEIPSPYDAVVMIEHVEVLADDSVSITAPATRYLNVRLSGEDIIAGGLLLPSGHAIRAADIGTMLAAGLTEVDVRCKPRLAIIPTGSELVPPGIEPGPGQILEFNSAVLAALVTESGAQPAVFHAVPDEMADLEQALHNAVEMAEIVVFNGASSAGREDFVPELIKQMGDLTVMGVNIRPGKPTALGYLREKPVLGLPGYPVSAVVAFEQFVHPLICKFLGVAVREGVQEPVRTCRKIPSKLGTDEFIRVHIASRNGERVVSLPMRGAGSVSSLSRADGVICVPANLEGLPPGTTTTARLLRDRDEIASTIICAGTYNPAIDTIAEQLWDDGEGYRLRFVDTGTVEGLRVLRLGEAHAAVCSVLDPAILENRLERIAELTEGEDWELVPFVTRAFGWCTKEPMALAKIEQMIASRKCRLTNRRASSNTHAVLDTLLTKLGLEPRDVPGYHRQEKSALGAATSVLRGWADLALVPRSASEELDLSFVSLFEEQCYLVIPRATLETPSIKTLHSLIRERAN